MKEYIIGIDPGIGQSAASLIKGDYVTGYNVVDYICPVIHRDYTWLHKSEIVAKRIHTFAREKSVLNECIIAIEKPIVRPWGSKLVNQFLFVGSLLYCLTQRFYSEGHEPQIYWVYPNSAKLALTDGGRAKKKDMVDKMKTLEGCGFITQMRKPEREAIADSVGIALAVGKKLGGVERLC